MRFGLGVLCLIAAGTADSHTINPVEQVTGLLERLTKEIKEEGASEAAAYDKYACFCKEQADDKLYAIRRSEEREEVLEGLIEAKSTTKEGLDAEILEQNEQVNALEEEQEASQEARGVAHGTYATQNALLEKAIKAVDGAIQTLQASKGGMSDMHEQLGLGQTGSVIQNAVQLAKEMGLATAAEAAALLQSEPNHAYGYHSNEIVATLVSLLKNFKQQDVRGDEEERAAEQAHQMAKGAKANLIKNLEHTTAQKAAQSAQLDEEINDHSTENQEVIADWGADKNFLYDLTGKCEEKARLFDQRSSTRSSELTQIGKAMEMLRGDVKKMYPANKLGLINPKKAPVEKSARKAAVGHWEWVADANKASTGSVSLLQIARPEKTHQKVIDYLESQALSLKSEVLMTMVMKAKTATGPFVKVKQMIQDLVSRLEQEAQDEASQKAWCDTRMATATSDRDDAQVSIEGLNADHAENTAKIAELTEDIQTLSDEIASLQKALNEATLLREQEEATNNQTIADASAGEAAVINGINFLNEFYNPGVVVALQEPEYQVWQAANVDRSGKTVEDRAPAGEGDFSGEYGGKGKESEGIIGLLTVIKDDFSRTVSDTTSDEEAAVLEFNTFKGTTEGDISGKTTLKGTKEGTKSNTESDLVQNESDLDSEKGLLAAANEELERLQPVCVDTGMEWKERAARRKQEVESLKNALKILQNTDFGFLQQ